MKKIIFIITLLFSDFVFAQEEKKNTDNGSSFNAVIGVVDMKKILAQSKAYQSLVDQFEEVRRKQRNSFTKQEDIIRDEESELLKKKNILSKEVYAEKVKELNIKINKLKSQQQVEGKKFESSFDRSTKKIQGALVDVLSVLANSNKLNLVLAKSQVILVGKEIDITDKAIAELNKVLPKVNLKVE